MKTKRCLSLMKGGIMEQLAFRMGTITIVIGNLAYLVVIYYLWRAIYAAADSKVVNGMTFNDTMIYLVLASALFYFMELYIVWDMGRKIQSGGFVFDILKPMGFLSYTFWQCSGNYVVAFFTTFLPTAVIVYFVTHGAIHLGFNVLFFLISVIFALFINFYIDIFAGIVCIHTQTTWGINIMKEVIIALLSGSSIPVAFYPEWLQKVIYCLPFQAIYNTPLSILIRPQMKMSELVEKLVLQIVWVAVMYGLTKVYWEYSLRKLTVNGG